MQIYVTGLGLISSIGLNVAQNLTSLINGKSGIGAFEYLSTRHQGILPVGEIKLSNQALADMFEPKESGLGLRNALLSMIAVKEALIHAGLFANDQLAASMRTGLISGTTVGGMDTSEDFYALYLKDPSKGRLRNIIHHDPGAVTDLLARELGFTHFVSTISTACSSAANAIMLGARMIRQGLLDRVVVGGTDALTRFTVNGFNSLMILDKSPCKPFDANRQGLNLGEGAGFIVLESAAATKRRESHILCSLSGYGNANDAHHQTASSPDGRGAFMAMDAALKVSGLSPHDISYINVHGTGTSNNDLSEGIAIKRIFGETPPPFSSTKAFTGHTLAAAGGLEAVYAVLAIQTQQIFPNLRFETPIPALGLVPETSLRTDVPIQHVLSNSFGFGGNCTSLLFSKCLGISS